MKPNTVTVTKVDFKGRDLAGGRQGVPTALNHSYRVAVQPTSAEDLAEHEREQGVRYFTVKFYEDPGLRNRDELTDELGRMLVVVGPLASAGGRRRTWPVLCAYRPVPGK